jgi:hypothetical protein
MSRFGHSLAVFGIAPVLVVLSWLTISTGVPTVLSPLNLVVMLPLMFASEWLNYRAVVLAILVVPLFYCVWCYPAWTNRPEVPLRSLVLFAIFAILSAIYLATSYLYDGVDYQGRAHRIALAVINICWYVAILGLAIAGRRRPTYGMNLAFHAALFSWLAWYAFPWLGELP